MRRAASVRDAVRLTNSDNDVTCGSIAAKPTIKSSTERASRPAVSSVGLNGGAPPAGHRPFEVRRPAVPVNEAGERHEPPESLPSAQTQLPSHNETPAPELDPPLMRCA